MQDHSARSLSSIMRTVRPLGAVIVALFLSTPVMNAGDLGDAFDTVPVSQEQGNDRSLIFRARTVEQHDEIAESPTGNAVSNAMLMETNENPIAESNLPLIQKTANGCGTPGIATDMASTVSTAGRPWLSIQPKLTERFENRSPPSGELAVAKFGTYANAQHVGRGCVRFDIGTEFVWAAPAFRHQPLYFEQVALERYGHSHYNWHVESMISAAHFFAAIPILPYKIGAEPVCSYVYTYGRGRPGNCNPACRENLPWSWRGFVFQGLATPGFVAILP